jgi:hypothetical protein
MLLRVVCPQCASEIFALPQSAGKVGHCACGGSFVVPTAPAGWRLSNRAAVLLVAAAVGVGLTAGVWPGKRPAARQLASAPLAEGPVLADVARVEPPAISSLPLAPAPPAQSPAAGGAPAPTSQPPALPSLNARDLFRLFKDNPAGADARYRGRTVRVRGELALPSEAEDGDAAGLVTFGAEEVPPTAYPEPVPSRVGVLLRAAPSRQTAFRALPSGAAVEVEGRCTGWRADPSAHGGGLVVLEDCRLVRPATR